MPLYLEHTEEYDRGRIEIWRRTPNEPWFVTLLPNLGEDGYPGRRYSRATGVIPADVPDDLAALSEWAMKLVPDWNVGIPVPPPVTSDGWAKPPGSENNLEMENGG